MNNIYDQWLHGEPSVEELLSDPIVHLMMRYDGITAHDVWAAMQVAQSRLPVAIPLPDVIPGN
ncbi:MAG: hypothetical protein ACYSVY_21760 [Planctomycetota bacterium]|jgi:hypothetical protein